MGFIDSIKEALGGDHDDESSAPPADGTGRRRAHVDRDAPAERMEDAELGHRRQAPSLTLAGRAVAQPMPRRLRRPGTGGLATALDGLRLDHASEAWIASWMARVRRADSTWRFSIIRPL